MMACRIAQEFVAEEPPTPKVLVIEDDQSIILYLVRAFSPWAIEVRSAGTYAEVEVELEEPGAFDLVVLDLKIPHCNTSDLLRLVADKSRCPVMVYSGNIDDHHMQKAINILNRFIWFIEKPASFTQERVAEMFRLSNIKLRKRDHCATPGRALKPEP